MILALLTWVTNTQKVLFKVLFSIPLCFLRCMYEEFLLVPTRMVLCRLELTLLNISFPTMVAMVGKTRAPHRILVADTWSARGLASAGIRGTGQPIPAEMHRQQQAVEAGWNTHDYVCPWEYSWSNKQRDHLNNLPFSSAVEAVHCSNTLLQYVEYRCSYPHRLLMRTMFE